MKSGKKKCSRTAVIAFSVGYAQLAEPLVSEACAFVRRGINTREYGGTIKVPNGGKCMKPFIRQFLVEQKSESMRTLDRSNDSRTEQSARALRQMNRP
jgi:hypothetical protein